VAIAALVVGFALPSAMAGFTGGYAGAAYRGGGYRGGGFSGGSHYSPRPAPRNPAPNSHPSRNYAPKKPLPNKPAHKKYVPPKPAPQTRVAQKHEPQKHTPPKQFDQRNTARRYHPPQKNAGKRSTPSPHVTPLNSKRRHTTPPIGKKKLSKKSHSHASHDAHRRHPSWRHPGWRHFHRRHHYWHHPWWLYDDYDYYDDYWYSTSLYFDYADLQRQAAINSIRAQIAVAEAVLESALSRQEISEKELAAAQARIVEARAVIDGAVAQQVESNATMREIETRLLAEQGSDSECVQAQAKAEAMRAAIDREVHRVLSLPPHAGTPTPADYTHELAMLSPDQKEKLDGDALFLEAIAKLRAAMQEVARARQALFEKNPDWVVARDKAVKAKQAQTQADRDLGKVTGVGQLSRKLELHDAQALAAQARAVIAAGRAAIRSLGESVPAAKYEQSASSSL
jgi:hypothetical protein